MRCQRGSLAGTADAWPWARAVAVAVVLGATGCAARVAPARPEPLAGPGYPARASSTTAAPVTPPSRVPSSAVVLPVPRPSARPQDAAASFVAEYVTYSWREPPGSAAVRAAAYATLGFGRDLVAGSRPYAGWSGVVERQEDARGIVEASYGEGGPDATSVAITVLVRVELRWSSGSLTSRRALAVRVEASANGWLVAGIDQ